MRSVWFVLNLVALLVFTAFAPLEQTLGGNIRLVYLHGAWVWAGLAAFGISAISGLFFLVLRNHSLWRWSGSLAWTGMALWLTYLPMSLLVMRINWGGFYFDEPRWRIPLTFAIVGVLLQAGLWLVNKPSISALANLGFGAALWWSTLNMRSILHPDSPVFDSGSARIQLYFSGLLLLSLLAAFQIARHWLKSFREVAEAGKDERGVVSGV